MTDAVLGVVRGLNEAIMAKSPFTSGYSQRVGGMAVCLGRHIGLNAAFLGDLYLAGLLHDVGKIGIRDSVLQRDALTEEEQAHVREHPIIGDTIVARIKNLGHLRAWACAIIMSDSTAWVIPTAWPGSAIPLLARILSVADGCDAMMSPSPYRPGLPTREVDAIMSAGAGTQWDPRLIEHFLSCRHEMYRILSNALRTESHAGAITAASDARASADRPEPAAFWQNRWRRRTRPLLWGRAGVGGRADRGDCRTRRCSLVA